jgi:hypothetical protein
MMELMDNMSDSRNQREGRYAGNIAPMFADCPANVVLPAAFRLALGLGLDPATAGPQDGDSGP